MYVCMYVYCKELYSLQYVFMYLLQFSWVWEVDVEVDVEVEFEVKSAQFDLRSDQLYCCTAVGLLIELRFELKSLTFDSVLTGIWRNSLKFPKNSFKVGFLVIPSVKHLKKYEKGGFLTTFINMYFMGVWQFKIGKTIKCDVLKRVTNLP